MTEQYSRDDLVHKIMYEVGKAAVELRIDVVSKVFEARDADAIDDLVREGRVLLMVSQIAERVLENMRKR